MKQYALDQCRNKGGNLSCIFILYLINIGLGKVSTASLLKTFTKSVYSYRISSLTAYS